MDVFEWIRRELRPRPSNSEELVYDHMESQSERSLPLIYQPFDVMKKSHWRDRGAAYDYLYSTEGAHKRLLDFGPGDGWPSLIVAPFAAQVIGVEGSHRRVEVCTQNAARLGITNADFVYVAPGTRLPFEDGTFDGVMAASSVEQTPDPRATLAELFRVLRPAGRLRIAYESLNRYRDGRQRDFWLYSIDSCRCGLILEDRDIEGERAIRYGLTYAMACEELKAAALDKSGDLDLENISVSLLEGTRGSLIDARLCATIHPSSRTLGAWLGDIGFSEIMPTHSGIHAAGQLFDNWPPEEWPKDMESLDRLLMPIVDTPAPVELDPMITARK
jgi:SAM-dependent methyltransferase